MVNLHDIRYLRIGTPDLDSAVEFATRIVGLQLVGREGKAAYFRSDKVAVRGDTRDHTLVYFEGDPSDHVIGFDLKDRGDLDRAGAEIEKAGHPVRYGTRAECELRRAQQFLAFQDPSGNNVEIVVRPYHSGTRTFPSRDAGITEFLAKPISAKALYQRILNVVANPRPFIKTKTYFGPDRRRNINGAYIGPERRVGGEAEVLPQPSLLDKAKTSM